MAATLLEVLRLSTRFLADRGSPSARLDAELLTAHSLGLRRIDLYLQYDRPLREDELEPIRALLRRRARGEPVAYLTGEKEFHGRAFSVTPAVLIPRPDTETLVERALAWARATAGPAGDGLRLADLGTGSGCIAVTMAAELPGAVVVASDVSPEAAAIAQENARRHGVEARLDIRVGAWEEPLLAGAPYDALLSNPPYIRGDELPELMPDVRDFEPHLALDGGDGMEAYRRILGAMPRLLRAPGYCALEVDPRRADEVATAVRDAWPAATVTVVADLAGHDRVVEAVIPA